MNREKGVRCSSTTSGSPSLASDEKVGEKRWQEHSFGGRNISCIISNDEEKEIKLWIGMAFRLHHGDQVELERELV
jgi:hypothetical protein